jgi:glycosyltransferase involved in cell wall biosynthesis
VQEEVGVRTLTKILIITVHPLYPISHGGIVRVIEEAKFLTKNGIEVHLAGNFTKKRYLGIVENITGAKAYSFSILTYLTSGILSKFGLFTIGWINNSFIRWDINKLVKKIKPDIIQVEFIHTAHQVSIISKKFNIPLIISEHNVEYIKLSIEKQGDITKFKLMEKNICNSANYITTVSEKDKEELIRIGVNRPIKTIPNGVDYQRFQIKTDVRDRLRQKYGIQKDDIVLIFHGTLNYNPNITANELLKNQIFPELSSKYKNLKLLLIGPGRTSFISNKVIELSEITFDEFPMHLSMGDIGVVPLTAGSGTRLKIIEYLALGIPTVSTEIGAEGLPVCDNRDILISRDAKDDLINKITVLLNDKKLQQRLSKNGKKLVIEELDWNVVLKKYLRIYEELKPGKGLNQ